jgi:hypothetical protein
MKATIKAHQSHAGGVLGNEIETRALQCLDGEIGGQFVVVEASRILLPKTSCRDFSIFLG